MPISHSSSVLLLKRSSLSSSRHSNKAGGVRVRVHPIPSAVSAQPLCFLLSVTLSVSSHSLWSSVNIVDLICWRYNLRHGQVENWLQETDWNYDGIGYPLAFEKTISYLLKLNLLEEEEAKDWREKLFV